MLHVCIFFVIFKCVKKKRKNKKYEEKLKTLTISFKFRCNSPLMKCNNLVQLCDMAVR